jgi:hypothetical protein
MGVTFAVLERWPGDEYRRLTGVLGAYSIGSVVGPSLGAIGGIRGPFLAHLGLVVAAAVVVAALGAPRERTAFGSDRAALRAPGFWLASTAIMLVALGLGCLEGPLPLHFADRLSQGEIGALYVVGAVLVGVSAWAGGSLRPRLALAAGAAAIVAGIGLAGLTDTVPLWVIAVVLTGFGLGAGEAGALGVLLETVGAGRIVLAMVVWSQVWAVGYLAGPAAAGGVAEAAGFGAIGLVPLAAALAVGVAFVRAPAVSAAEPSV